MLFKYLIGNKNGKNFPTALSFCVFFSLPSLAADTNQTIFLVRHAEKAQGTDPGLTAAGKARAEALAEHYGTPNCKG